MVEIGRKVSFNLTKENERKENEIREKWENEGGNVPTAFVMNMALALLYKKEFPEAENK